MAPSARATPKVGPTSTWPCWAALPQFSFTTRTPWYKAPKRTRQLLHDVLAAVGASGQMLTAVAIDDKVEIPAEIPQKFSVVLARLMDGPAHALARQRPAVRRLPLDSSADLRSERYYWSLGLATAQPAGEVNDAGPRHRRDNAATHAVAVGDWAAP